MAAPGERKQEFNRQYIGEQSVSALGPVTNNLDTMVITVVKENDADTESVSDKA